MDIESLLPRIGERLRATFGARLKGVFLYGSTARGEAGPDSDVDLMVLLEEPVVLCRDIETITRSIYPLQLEVPEHPIHALPVGARQFERQEFSLFRNVRGEGVRL